MFHHRRPARGVVIGLSILLLVLLAAGQAPVAPSSAAGGPATPTSAPAGGDELRAGRIVSGPARTITLPATATPPDPSSNQARRAVDHDRPPLPPVPVEPGGPRSSGRARVQPAPLPARADGPLAPEDVTIFRSSPLGAGASDGSVSTTNEPSLAQSGNSVFYTGNWYAARSSDGGQTFTYIDPYTAFGSPYNGFCCDQVAIYDPSRDLFVWVLQYIKDGTGNNAQRLAIAKGQAGLAANTWTYFDLTAQSVGFATNNWLDYPHLALGANSLYLTTNVFNGTTDVGTGTFIARWSLDTLASLTQGSTPTGNFVADTIASRTYTPVQGAGTTIYFARHLTTGNLRVFAWPESSTTATSADVAHSTYPSGSRGDGLCAAPDGTNMCGFVDGRLHTGWVASGVVGFMWSAIQGTGGIRTFTYPYLHVVRINQVTMALIDEPIIYNDLFAYAYPAVGVNSRGHLGLSVAFGGGSVYPSSAVAILDDLSIGGAWSWMTVRNGTHGPGRDRWGDYLAARPYSGNGATWVASAFTQQGPCTSTFTSLCANVEPRYVWFGRSRDDPAAPTPTATATATVTVTPSPTPTATVTPTPPPTQGDLTWYFAEGYTGTGFDEYLTIQNPNPQAAQVRLTYFLGTGAPLVRLISVPANARYTIAVHGTAEGVGRGQAVSAKLESTNGVGVIVERPIYFTYNGATTGITGGHNVMGVNAPRATWLFAEGYTAAGFDEYLTILNPNPTSAPVEITYFLGAGGPITKTISVPASSRYTVAVHEPAQGVGRGQAVSARVTTTQPGGIVVERPMYFRYTGGASPAPEGHNVMGAAVPATTWFFPDGATTTGVDLFLTIMNTDASPAPTTLTYYVTGEPLPRTRAIVVPANTRYTVAVHEAAEGVGRGLGVAMKVETTLAAGIVVERPIYFPGGATNVLGATAPRQHWYFAEGYTGAGFSQQVVILNSNTTAANVTITYQLTNAAPKTVSVTVPGNSRRSVSVNDPTEGVGAGQAVSAAVTTSHPGGIVVERPMTFLYTGGSSPIQGAHTVLGYAP